MTLQGQSRIRMIHNNNTDKDKRLAQARIQASIAAKKWALQIHKPKRRTPLPDRTMPRPVFISRSSYGEVADTDKRLAEARIKSRIAAKTWVKSRQKHEPTAQNQIYSEQNYTQGNRKSTARHNPVH
jgi:hypothetical protein